MVGGRVLNELVKILRKLLDQYRASVLRVRGAARAGRAWRMLRVEVGMWEGGRRSKTGEGAVPWRMRWNRQNPETPLR